MEAEPYEEWPSSTRFKRRMNRLFREEAGMKRIPHPEVDTVWERLRSRCVVLLKRMNKAPRR